MSLQSSSITIAMASVKLDGKKITNAILDQIPRLDVCDVLDSSEGNVASGDITPLYRFSLISLLNSERRIYKVKGYNLNYVERLVSMFDYQEDGFFFTLKGALYCDSFSSSKGTKRYGEIHNKLSEEILDAETRLQKIERILSSQGDASLDELTLRCHQYTQSLPNGVSPDAKLPAVSEVLKERQFQGLDFLYDDDENTIEKRYAMAYFRIIDEYGSWVNYIAKLKTAVKELLIDITSRKDALSNYENNVGRLISEVSSKPFALLGC